MPGLRERLTTSRCVGSALIILIVLFLWLALPLPRRLDLPAVVEPVVSQTVYVPWAGTVRDLAVKPGQDVEAGQLLLRLEDPVLTTRRTVLQREQAIGEAEIRMLANDETGRERLAEAHSRQVKLEAQLAELDEAIAQGRIQALVAGRVINWDETLMNGQAVPEQAVLGRIEAVGAARVSAYVHEDALDDIAPGEHVVFLGRDGSHAEGTVKSVDPVRAEIIPHVAVTSLAGGDLAAQRTGSGAIRLLDSVYRVEVSLTPGQSPPRLGQSGWVRTHTPPRSLLAGAARHVLSVLWQESTF